MATLPFLILMWWFGAWLESKEKERKQALREVRDWARAETKTKPKYRMKEVNPEDDELFMTDLGDFDEAFKL